MAIAFFTFKKIYIHSSMDKIEVNKDIEDENVRWSWVTFWDDGQNKRNIINKREIKFTIKRTL